MKNIIKKGCYIGLSITGSIIGVGFASGREIVTFFVRYGWWSLLFCFFAAVLFSIICYLVFNLNSYNSKHLNSHKKEKCKVQKNGLKNDYKVQKYQHKMSFDSVFNVVLMLCQVILCGCMFAGFAEILAMLNLSEWLIILLMILVLFVAYILIDRFSNSVYLINGLLSIVLFGFILILFILLVVKRDFSINKDATFSVGLLYMPTLYVGMNIFTSFPLIEDLSFSLYSKKEKIVASSFVFLGIFMSLIFVSVILLLFGFKYYDSSMAMLDVGKNASSVFGFCFIFVVLLGVLSTLFSTGFGAIKKLEPYSKNKLLSFIVLLLAFLFSFLGFKNVIDFVYPFLGLVCLIFVLFKVWFKNGLNNKKRKNI